jgi:hypothetical protein
MPFDWMVSNLPDGHAARGEARASAALEREAEERAGLLLRLGYSLQETQLRVRGNVLWDHELAGRPALAARCDEIVRRVFDRQSAKR